MNKQICLSIEQMKYLEELGLDTSDASMCYVSGCLIIINDLEDIKSWGKDVQPAYTLQDILNHFDAYILYHFKNGTVAIESCIGQMKHEIKSKESELDTAYNMLVWCIKNGYIEIKI